MPVEISDQSEYYRRIAKEFLQRRGAPFFLSPKDMAVIAGWEARRVPLAAVLEGVDRAFERSKSRARGTRGISLTLCEREVERALEQHRDRSAGRRGSDGPRADKQERARREVERALRESSPEDADLADLYGAALKALSSAPPDEEALDRIETSIESLLYDRATSEDTAHAVRLSRRDLPDGKPEEVESLSRTRVVKAMRKAGRVPYVSLFYY
jgi:hypothetical protein